MSLHGINMIYRHPANPPKGIKRNSYYKLHEENDRYYVINDDLEKLEYNLNDIKNMFLPSGNVWSSIEKNNKIDNVPETKKDKEIKPNTEEFNFVKELKETVDKERIQNNKQEVQIEVKENKTNKKFDK